MFAAYAPGYFVDLGNGHPFPMRKYPLVHAALTAEGTLPRDRVIEPCEASAEDLLLVHTPHYLDRLFHGALAAAEQRRLGFPWSPALVRRSRLAAHGTLLMARRALADGIAANLAGGSHHAFSDHGEGYCALNDVAVALRALRREGRARRFALIDCDAHQGNGNHAIFAGDAEVFTFSMHGERNYPEAKIAGNWDIGLPDGTPDGAYLAALEDALPQVLDRAHPDLVFYIAGVDPYVGDRLGRLALTLAGLRSRDHLVLAACRARGIPAVITFAGGYAQDLPDTVEAHCNTIRTATLLFA
ncbi:MAG TPA: histone deacetylase [Candidatus Methylomirabilis sp.]